jgi:hypothetical protein
MAAQAQPRQRINYQDWQLLTAEEFNQPLDTVALGQRWRYFFPWGRTLNYNEVEYYTSRGVRAGDGVLNLTSERLATSFPYRGRDMRFTSGMLMSRYQNDSLTLRDCTKGAEGYSHGLFEIRCRQPRDGASFPAFWLFGGIPDEIDIFEATPYYFNSTFHIMGEGGYWRPTRRHGEHCACSFYDHDPAGNLSEQFHTYGLVWLPNEVIFYYDGIPIRHETRLVPSGCSMWLIANLAVLDWANVPGDTLAIDYIRVYAPRAKPVLPAVLRPGADYPQSELAWLPFEQQPGRFDQASYQRWTATARPTGQLALELTDNYNPSCDVSFTLPVAGHWAPPWTQTYGTPEIQVQLPDGSGPLEWAVRDTFGEEWAHGTAAGGSVWRPKLAALPPGAYTLRLRQGTATAVQPLVVLGRAAGSKPDAAWSQPAAPPPTE